MPVDPSILETYREVMEAEGDDFVADILNTFYPSAQELMDSLDEALRENDVDRFVRAAHSFKSTSATVGALCVSGLAADLEARGMRGDLPALKPLLVELREAYEVAEIRLKELFS